jgi:hypothetical protein
VWDRSGIVNMICGRGNVIDIIWIRGSAIDRYCMTGRLVCDDGIIVICRRDSSDSGCSMIELVVGSDGGILLMWKW